MHTKAKRMLWLLLGLGLCLLAPEALAWGWNQYQARPYNGFESYSGGFRTPAYGYRPYYPKIYRRAYRPYYYGNGYRGYGYRHHHHRPHFGNYGYSPSFRYYPGCRY